MEQRRHRIGQYAAGPLVLTTGMGSYVALLLTLLHRWSTAAACPTWAYFVAGAFAGLALVGFLGVAASSKSPYQSHPATLPRLLPSLCGVLAIAGAYLAQTTAPGAAPSIMGVHWSLQALPAGIGIALLAIPWARAYGTLPLNHALCSLGGALATGAVLDALPLLAPALPLSAIVLLETCWAATAPLVAKLPDVANDGPSPVPDLRSLGAHTWKPLVGAAICLFIFGFTWDTDTLGMQLSSSQAIAYEKIVGLLIAAAVFAALAWYGRQRNPMPILLNAVLPVLVVTFIVRPYFLSLTLGELALAFVGVARETGFIIFVAAAWIASTQAAPQCNMSATFAGTSVTGSCGFAGLLGLYGPLVLGPVASYVGAILFTIYLVGIVIVATVGRAKDGASPDTVASDPAEADARFAELVELRKLTPRETDIATYLRRGHSYAYIATALTVSENTVRTHVRNIYRKFGVSSREELIESIHGEERG